MKNRKISIMALIMAIVLVFGLTFSYAGDPVRTGTAAGVQTLVPVGARYLAMGGANIANVSGVDGIYWNPAGLSELKNSATGSFSTMTIFNDVKVNYIGLGFNVGSFGNLGVTLKAFDFGDIPLTTVEDPDAMSGRTFSPTFVTAGVTYAAKLTASIQIGVTGKLIYEAIDRASASAFAIDAGIQYHGLAGIEGLSIGLVVRNIGTNMQYSGSALTISAQEQDETFTRFLNREASSDQLPARIELGLGYLYNIDANNKVLFSGNFNNNNFGNDVYKLGVEYSFGNMFALRGGYLIYDGVAAEDALYSFTAGAGFNYSLGGIDFTIDYAYRDSQYFNGNNLFSLKIGF